MMPRLKVVRFLLLIAALMGPGNTLRAAESAPCENAVRYRMPDGVELKREGPGAVAPADLPGSRSGYEVPSRLGFDLGFNPVGEPFDESPLNLGRVEIDRETGRSTIDGRPLGGPAGADAACVETGLGAPGAPAP